MKKIMENWARFVKQQNLNEATEEEISYIDDALEIPIEKMPFGNIFGDKYRIIEKLKVIDPDSPFKITMDALAKMGWQVSEPSDIKYDDKNRISGKVLCNKTKITHYIDKAGEIQVVRRAITMNLPKLLKGIINFVENSFNPLREKHFDVVRSIAIKMGKRGSNPKPPEEKFDLPSNVFNKPVTKREYMGTMKFLDTASYWIGFKPSMKAYAHADGIEQFYKDKKIDIDKIKEFSSFLNDRFQNFLENVSKLYQNYYIIYSRHPVDVFRMSDHEGISSCHDLPSRTGGWDEHNICALAEVYGNGLIAYAVPEEEFENKGVDPSIEGLGDFEDEEIFADEDRGKDGIVPSSRIRIRHVSYHGKDKPIRLAIPEKRLYGVELPGLRNKINSKMAFLQKDEIDDISKTSESIDLDDFTRHGGEWQDNPASATIPMLFKQAGKVSRFTGTSVRHDSDIQNSVAQKVGYNTKEALEIEIRDIFDSHQGGMIDFNWNVSEDYDGSAYFTWYMIVNFSIDMPKKTPDDKYGDIYDSIRETVESYFEEYFQLPSPSDMALDRTANRVHITIHYDGSDLSDIYLNYEELDSTLQNILHEEPNIHGIFDYYISGGPIQLIEFDLEKNGIIPSETFRLEGVMKKYDLNDESKIWWIEDEKETEEHDEFYSEYVSSISYEEQFEFYPYEIIEEIPDQIREIAYRYMVEILNLLANNFKVSTELAIDSEYVPGTTIPIYFEWYGIDTTSNKIDVETLAKIVEEEDKIDFIAKIKLTNDMPVIALEHAANFLIEDADIDNVVSRVEEQVKKYVISRIKKDITENKGNI